MEWFDFKVFKTTKIFIVTILFGAGTDFCLFLISRYREEITRGFAPPQALAQAIGHVGEAITASAMTTIFGLSMMFFADFGKFRNSGPAIGLCLLVALIACLTLAPALLRLFGRGVFWPFGAGPRPMELSAERQSHANTLTGRFWEWIAGAILARPGLILLGSIALLSPLAYAGTSIRISYDLVSDLPPDRPCVVGTQILESHFSAGELGPITVVAYQPTAEFDQEAGKQQISLLTKALYDSPGVISVRSIAEPLGDKPGKFNPFSPAGRRKLAALRNPRTKATFLTQVPELAGKVTQLQIVLNHDPFSLAAAAALDELDNQLKAEALDPESPWHGSQFEFVGVTAGTRDLKAVTRSDQRLIERLVTLAVLGILLVVLRRPLVCLYLIASVLFSYYVTIGATQLVFELLDPGFQGLDWKVPIFLFVILIAVGEDYNIFLMTRVIEEQQRWGLLEGLRRAVVSTGGIITSCGVIMAGTFVSMMTGTLRAMLELGFALTLGVLLDTLVVRPILVPAFLALIYRRTEHLAIDDVEVPPTDIGGDSGPISAKLAGERNYRPVGS
jgi:RND superfamily putative drug exporter